MHCQECGIEFSRSDNLKRHMNSKHKLNGTDRTQSPQKRKRHNSSQRFAPYPKVTTSKPVEQQCDRFRLLHPFTALVAGMTGSGKTVWVQTLLEHASQTIQSPPQRIVWSYSQWQPAYDQMLEKIPGIQFVKGIPHDIDEDLYFDPKINNLMVIDDQMTETSNDKRILNLFTKGSHHRNLSVIFLMQNLYFQGKIMRTLSLNASYLVLFKNPRDKLQMMTLGKQMYPGKTEQFLHRYETAVQRPFGYLFVDLKPNTREECRLRTNVLPHDFHPSQTGGQLDAMKTVANFFQRQGYLQSPQLKAMQELEQQMNAVLEDPNMSPDLKIKEYGSLFKRYLALQQQLSLLSTQRKEPTPFEAPLTESSPFTNVTTPVNATSTNVSRDSGIITAKTPSFLERLTSKIKTPSFGTRSQEAKEPSTPFVAPFNPPVFSTPDAEASSSVFPPTPPSSEPESPLTSRSRIEKPARPKWLSYKDATGKYKDVVFQPPRRSERLRAVIKSIPGWEKY